MLQVPALSTRCLKEVRLGADPGASLSTIFNRDRGKSLEQPSNGPNEADIRHGWVEFRANPNRWAIAYHQSFGVHV
jgi:hypothetical protein